MQGFSYLGKITVVSYMVWSSTYSNNNMGIKIFFHFDIPTKYQYLIGVTNLISTCRFFDTMHSPIRWSLPLKDKSIHLSQSHQYI